MLQLLHPLLIRESSTKTVKNNTILHNYPSHAAIILNLLQQGETVHFVAQGPSMYPLIRSGSHVSVTPWNAKSPISPGTIIFFQQHNRLTLHRVIRHDTQNKKLHIIADAALSGLEAVTESSVLGIGQYLFRDKKKYRLNALYFRLFGFLLYYTRPLRRLWSKIRKKAETLKN